MTGELTVSGTEPEVVVAALERRRKKHRPDRYEITVGGTFAGRNIPPQKEKTSIRPLSPSPIVIYSRTLSAIDADKSTWTNDEFGNIRGCLRNYVSGSIVMWHAITGSSVLKAFVKRVVVVVVVDVDVARRY